MQHPDPVTRGRASRTAVALVVTALAAVTACARSRPEQASNAVVSPGPTAATPASAQRLDARTKGWAVGKAYPYRLKLTTKLAFADAPNRFDFDITGQALVLPMKVTPEEATLYLSVADATMTSRVDGTSSELDKSAADMRAAGIFFTLAGGRISELRIVRGQSSLASTAYRTIASALQFARPEAAARRYASEEHDTTGRALTEYEATADPLAWRKTKIRYLAVLGTASAFEGQRVPLVPEIVSRGEVRLAPSGRPAVVAASEKVTVQGAQIPIRSDVTLELTGAPERTVEQPAAELERRLAMTTRVAASQPIGSSAPIEDLDKARIGSFDFEHLLARLEQIAKERAEANADDSDPGKSPAAMDDAEKKQREGQVQEDSQLFFALGALLRQDRLAVRKARVAVSAGSPASSVLMDGLSSAGTPEAQAALVQLMDDKRIDEVLRSRAINALALTPKPSDAAIRALKALLRDDPFDMRALYGLGTFSRNLRDAGKAEQARELGELLVARSKVAKNSMDLVTVLRSIANSGYAGALPALTPHLEDAREDVRVAAVRGLQSMADPRVDDLLASRLKADRSNEVRLSALASIQVRPPSAVLVEALGKAATDAADATVRFRAVELMIRWLPERPALRAALEQVATSDTEPKVKNRAKAAL